MKYKIKFIMSDVVVDIPDGISSPEEVDSLLEDYMTHVDTNYYLEDWEAKEV